MDSLNAGKLNSFFGEGTVLKGKLKFKGILRLDGVLEGEVISGETFIVGKSGQVRADIKTNNLFNFGGIVGNVNAANKISLHAQSSLTGNINSPYLVAEESSFFEGVCQMPVEKRGPLGKLGKAPRVSSSAPVSPADMPGYDGNENGSGSWIKKIATLIVAGALVGGWYYYGGLEMAVPKVEKVAKVEVDQDQRGTLKEKPVPKPEPAVIVKKKEQPKPIPKVVEVLSETDRLKKEIKNNPTDPQPWLKLAFNSLKDDKYKSAIAILEESVKTLPKSTELRRLTATTYQRVGLEKDARRHFLILGEHDPRSIEAKVNDAYSRLEKGALEQAAEMFGNILEEDPENHRARLGLATVFSRREENKKAAIECLRILENSKNYAPALNRLAWIYAKQGLRLKHAKVLSKRSIKVFSNIPEYLDTLSEISYRLKEYDKAIELIKKAIGLAPGDSYYERQLFKFKRAKRKKT